MPKNEWMKLSPAEKRREYLFPGGDSLVFTNITAIYISDSGTHYLEYGDGDKVIVNPGWMGIKLLVDEWTHPRRS